MYAPLVVSASVGRRGGHRQQRLAHSTIAITLDIYSHVIPAMQEEAATLIAGLVFAGK